MGKDKTPVIISDPDEMSKMREACRLAAKVLDMISEHVRPGITTDALDKLCNDYTLDHGATAAPPTVGFPKAVCTSVNHVVCHGIPADRTLREGDIVNIDVTVIKDGFYGDTSKMFLIGKGSVLAKRLVQVTQECLYRGIACVKPGAKLGDIGAAIAAHAHANRFSVVREYCGHGIGRVFHGAPQVLHYGKADTGLVLEPGMTFTIEPMINAGKRDVKLLSDGWTVVTKDKKLSAQWEHTMTVTETGVEVLTMREEEVALKAQLGLAAKETTS